VKDVNTTNMYTVYTNQQNLRCTCKHATSHY